MVLFEKDRITFGDGTRTLFRRARLPPHFIPRVPNAREEVWMVFRYVLPCSGRAVPGLLRGDPPCLQYSGL